MAISTLIPTVKDFLNPHFNWNFITTQAGFKDLNQDIIDFSIQTLKTLLNILKDDIRVVVESSYIDKVFRDAYYYYFASKLSNVGRDCIRVSFLDSAIGNLDLTNLTLSQLNQVGGAYLGFVVIRPLPYAVIGRNTISPKAFKNSVDLSICSAPIPSTCLGMKTYAHGFPHSSQDGEMMSCAETTIWSIMEYFGNKYAEYQPILPSEIHEILKPTSSERQIPSGGLTFLQIASVFNHKGFGSKIYYNDNDGLFKELLTCYLESGIPVALALESDTIGHAVVAVGLKEFDRNNIRAFNKETFANGYEYYVWNQMVDHFIVNDDNQMPYQIVPFDNPTIEYHDTDWDNVKISNLIVPLNKKIYMEAETAIGFSKDLIGGVINVKPDSVIKTFLASGRSYKEYLVSNPDISDDKRFLFLNIQMPKFVWITEFSDIDACSQDKINGFMIVDATNPNPEIESLLFAVYLGNQIKFNGSNSKIEILSLNLQHQIARFAHNLS